MLLRLRQACDHPLLVKGVSSDPVGKDSSEMAKKLPREMLVDLLKQLETSLAICLVCRVRPSFPYYFSLINFLNCQFLVVFVLGGSTLFH